MKNQTGAALVLAMLMVALLSGMTVMQMRTSTMDLKMAGAGTLKVNADAILEGNVEQLMAVKTSQQQFSVIKAGEAYVAPNTPGLNIDVKDPKETLSCGRKRQASSDSVFSCRYIHLQLSREYGRKKQAGRTGTNALGLGVEQRIIKT
ncbi:pilus assembly PilX N-terminal domain-containing protein [Motilimonas pumila]|uniref:Type 4 fimbrial biogenesis protein PilX N-terminal domain-containing protein n=1 Tax=Motilimonas pumila TaxID=2303987 RepID=A0A418YGE3_9GAMM|nr:pilus assembly PilX N-terminal domain-containing protein [Motilimonas pumila]RJG48658.1 hypothetical protein D1Z90_07300 [Motilimonas pumila]